MALFWGRKVQTITEFCDRHSARREGREWALANCQTMDDVWRIAKPEWLIWVATCPGVLSHRDLVRFALFCAESVQHRMTDPRSTDALDVTQVWLDGRLDFGSIHACAAACAARAAYAAYAAAGQQFADWLRENTTPHWSDVR